MSTILDHVIDSAANMNTDEIATLSSSKVLSDRTRYALEQEDWIYTVSTFHKLRASALPGPASTVIDCPALNSVSPRQLRGLIKEALVLGHRKALKCKGLSKQTKHSHRVNPVIPAMYSKKYGKHRTFGVHGWEDNQGSEYYTETLESQVQDEILPIVVDDDDVEEAWEESEEDDVKITTPIVNRTATIKLPTGEIVKVCVGRYGV